MPTAPAFLDELTSKIRTIMGRITPPQARCTDLAALLEFRPSDQGSQ